jgi:N-acetylglucosaminyl-diphospho-decaprenol L-rhamnosyltransferase
MGRTMLCGALFPVIIVGFCNPLDVIECLGALRLSIREAPLVVFICENGGKLAFDALLESLSGTASPCSRLTLTTLPVNNEFQRIYVGCLGADGPTVYIGEAAENLGYAGGVNAWLRPLRAITGWEGVWVLNPDTLPEPTALWELVSYSRESKRGMVGSRIMFADDPGIVSSRGLKWRKWLGSVLGVDKFASASISIDPRDLEARIDSPHGASFYVDRPCIDQIGLMDERYFLYFEDLDWGLRAKAIGGLGFADNSVVAHVGGTTLGSAVRRAARSDLSVYLDFRNRLIFVRRHHVRWFLWPALVISIRSGEFLLAGSPKNFIAAVRGIFAGLIGETGKPKLR